ncbi:MAG: peptidyl-prolyl cis-trans isomerase, partial [Nitrospirae bacterium]|nr:peptidyl-prolyl cis-trans isomerase [Nitrospirota bacterium]
DRKALEAKLKDQEDKLKAVSTQAEHQKDRDKELAALTAKNYERPLVRIAGESYSVGRFVNESAAADNVKRKLKKGPAPWDRKNPLDTFILEEVLFHMAQKENMTAKGSDVDTLSREHGLSREEAQYLMKYLAVDNMYQRKAAEVALPSVDAKTYYEKNRDEFVSRPAGKSVRIMAIPYTANDELEKGILALEFLQEASKGKSLEDIARKNRSNASLREVPVDSLKGWLREKVDLLRDGELSPVISSGNEYVIMQTQKVKIQYRPYEEVRNEILKKLTPDNNEQKRLIEHWLGKIYDQAEFIR